jgi:tetratricopeptide (TPR) repeat protein
MTDASGNLRSLLRLADMSPEQFARRLNKHATDSGMSSRIDPKTPYKWFRGAVSRDPWPALTAAVLSAALGRKIGVEDLGWLSSSGTTAVAANAGLVLPWTAAGAINATAEVIEGGSMDRRIFLSLAGGTLTEHALEWLLALPVRDLESRQGSRRVLDAHVDSLEQMTDQLRRMDDQFGSGAVLELVRGQVGYVLNLLRHHSYTAAVGARLHGAAAETMRLAGFLSFDAGSHAQAQRYWIASLRAAHAAGDRSLGSNVLGFMSCQAKDLELHDEAIKLSEAARQGYIGRSPRVKAILNLRAAQAYAQTGEIGACRDAIDVAREALRGQPPESGEPPWSYWMDEAQANEQIGYCYIRLEDWGKAQHHLKTALQLQTDPHGREAALRQALLATTYARQGDPEHACQTGNQAVDILAANVESDRCISHVRQLQTALNPHKKLTAVNDFNERVRRQLGVTA